MAGLISLNIGELAPVSVPQVIPAPATKVPVDIAELGASGTPIFGGFLRELGEYNPEFTGFSAYRIYERMRRSDGQVRATLAALKLPIRGAEWTVIAPPDANAVEKEATEFVESCLMDELDFDAIIRNALLMLDFGSAVHENVWYIDGKNVRLRKCAARLPLTFYRWITAPDSDELVAIEQLGYRGGDYEITQIPADKVALFTLDQEGANYTGIALLRSMYQHWFIKSGLYKVEAIACERNGMGIPWMMMGPNAKVEDRSAANEWLRQLAVNEATSIVLPNGWEFGLEGVKGQTMSPKEAIEHHNAMITKAALAQFMDLGSGHSGGNRALGQTMSDFFYLSLQAVANQIGRVIEMKTVKPLCDYNFSGLRAYPRIVPQQILSTKFEVAVDALTKLANASVGIINPDDDIEAWARQKGGMPPAKNPRPRPAGGGGSAPPSGNSSAAAFSAVTTYTPTRQPRGPEKFLALSEISSRLDKGRDEISAALRDARPRIQAEVLQRLMSRPIREAHQVSVAIDGKLVDRVEGILRDVADYGLQSVQDERKRQMEGKAVPDARTIRAAQKRDSLGVYADGVVSEFTNGIQSRATAVAIDARRKSGTLGEQILAASGDLDAQKDGWVDNVAAKGTNEAFAEGREEGYEENKNDIGSVMYSALLDPSTCGPCLSADGQEGKTPADIPAVPNPDCDGGDKCRCVHVFVFADEAKAAA